jgi:nitrite reductase/ring-hydroxylating ferredoxin subunit
MSEDGFTYICEEHDLELDAIRTVELDGREVCLVRTSAGVFAFGTVCPHQGGPMCHGAIKGTMDPSDPNRYEFAHEGEVVTCPWHGYEFHMTDGSSVGGALKGRLAAYQVEVREGKVFASNRRVRPPRPTRPVRA